MSTIWIYSLLSVLIVSLISLVGIFTFSLNQKRLKSILNYLVSFAVGALIGDVFVHIIPELAESGFTHLTSIYIMSGILFTFIIEKIVHFHHFITSEPGAKKKYATYTITSLWGDSIHNFVDGLIIGGSFLASVNLGIATTIAVIMHEIPTEVGHFGVLIKGGFSKNKALFWNFVSALTSVLGVILILLIGETVKSTIPFLLAFTAGNFIYIAGSDFIPVLHKESSLKRSAMQFLYLILGIGIMYTLIFLE
ncbi:MAG: ZIP family metal transporter [bacterium]